MAFLVASGAGPGPDGRTEDPVRAARGLTQEDLAAKADLHPTYISDVERGVRNPSWDVIVRMAEGMAVPVTTIAHEYDKLVD